jgi:predicted regulator of Ras-like GTPase activity (Roadblock/LC7/MglB family)
MSEIETPMQQVVDHVVDGVPGVLAAVIASTDGFVRASRVPDAPEYDPAAIAAMSAANLALSSRLVQLAGEPPADMCVNRSPAAQACVFAIGTTMVMTVIADNTADTGRIELIAREVIRGMQNG